MDLVELTALAKQVLEQRDIKLKIYEAASGTIVVDASLAGLNPPWRGWREPFKTSVTKDEAKARLIKMKDYLQTGGYIYD